MEQARSLSRHDRGWPKLSLITWTSESEQTLRLHAYASGQIYNHDARGSWWEVIKCKPIQNTCGANGQNASTV
jgi:hypothetical protein